MVGYHLHHRLTDDLDLFTTDPDAFERGRFVLEAVAAEQSVELLVRQDAPGFRRCVLAGAEPVVVDLVLDRTPQVCVEKLTIDGVAVDPIEEIVANKLCAVVGRAEERDLVDLLALERSGHPIEDGLAGALAKDGGATPATLAWLLAQVDIPDQVLLPPGFDAQELRTFVADLMVRMRRLAHPDP